MSYIGTERRNPRRLEEDKTGNYGETTWEAFKKRIYEFRGEEGEKVRQALTGIKSTFGEGEFVSHSMQWAKEQNLIRLNFTPDKPDGPTFVQGGWTMPCEDIFPGLRVSFDAPGANQHSREGYTDFQIHVYFKRQS